MKGILICLVVVLVSFSSAQAQTKIGRNSSTSCLSIKEAKELVNNLKTFREGAAFIGGFGPARYGLTDLPGVKRHDPIMFLFYQRGYASLEFNGVHTFLSPTGKGSQLEAQYPTGEIPLSNVTLVSVNKITCTKSKARVDVVMSFKPTTLAIDLLGKAVYQTKPFNAPIRHSLKAKRVSGKWEMEEENINFFQ